MLRSLYILKASENMSKGALLSILMAISLVAGQDPAPGWMSYATANCTAGTKITNYEAKWTVGPTPVDMTSVAFYSPWIGMDTPDLMRLLQPVSPFFGGPNMNGTWVAYTEYFDWYTLHNHNSHSIECRPGDVLHGSIVYNGDEENSYTIVQKNLNTGLNSTQTVAVPRGNKYTVLYVVYEKSMWPCRAYPPNERLVFSDIMVECDGQKIAPAWLPTWVDDHCDNRMHIASPDEIVVTWNTSMKSRFSIEEAAAVNGRSWRKHK